jgi:hypothetical protein
VSQSKQASIAEAVVNTVVGFSLAWIAQMSICWFYGIPLSGQDNAIITFWMTVVSLLRSYIIRRLFNARKAEHVNG